LISKQKAKIQKADLAKIEQNSVFFCLLKILCQKEKIIQIL